jgi:hypothetical protein
MMVENAVGGSRSKAIPRYLLNKASKNARIVGRVGLRIAIQTRFAVNNSFVFPYPE